MSRCPAEYYLMDLTDDIGKFRYYHLQYANKGISEHQHDSYIGMVLEQMISHFDVQITAVQAFVHHYAMLITENTSPLFQYHPLRFLRPMMDANHLQRYMYCLYGFAEAIFNQFVDHGMYTNDGRLRASFERFESGQLHLVLRPEVSDVFLF